MSVLSKICWVLLAAIILAAASWWMYHHIEGERRIRQLEREKAQLQQIVERLTSHRRVAEIMLLGRAGSTADSPRMQLLFVEYARDGQQAVTIREFDIEGTEAHVDAKVIRFERDFLFQNDPLRGASVALFTRIHGNRTSPEKGLRIDELGAVPEVYRGAHPDAAEFEARLWRDFWRLLEDQQFANEHGVRIAQGEGVWWPPQDGRLYTLAIASDGGLELTSEPVRPIYVEAMRRLVHTLPQPLLAD